MFRPCPGSAGFADSRTDGDAGCSLRFSCSRQKTNSVGENVTVAASVAEAKANRCTAFVARLQTAVREIIYLSQHCHHQNGSCIKVGSDESHFNVSWLWGTKSQDSVYKPQLLKAKKGEPKQIRTEVPLSAYQPNASVTARPNRLTRKLSSYLIITIMYIYQALINTLRAHMIHINLNMIFYTHVEHSPTKTI